MDDVESEASLDSDDDEEEFPSYAPKVHADAGRSITSAETQGNEALQNAAQGLASQLRRRGKADDIQGAQAASGNSLFPSKSSTTTRDTSLPQTEALLSHNRNEQEQLSASLLEMAKQLKQQSIHFGNTLENDQSVLDRAVSSLDKNTSNMDAASQRMGTLRRMTEGKGWWDRIKLWAMIGVLWVACFLVVFLLPKIRF